MGVINVLDKHMAELIAAGEVVERPASVIKELVENSIDAGAKNITVEIKNGGTTFMRVADDGCGIYRDDIKKAFLRHATSKVKVQDDLDCISTLGFRGEALASICAVSRLQLITRNENEQIGTCYQIEGGEEKSFDDAGCPIGTTFVIRDLFYNIPARAKFLKKDVSEGNAVSNIIDKVALSHPEISFTYIKDGKQALRTYGDGKLLSAIYSVFGRDFANGLIPVDYKLDAISVKGYICKPENARPNRNMQNFFINGRYIKTRTGMAAIEEAFKGSIMVGKFPSCVLQLDLPYEIIDVNVHPAKIEVRFINERPVFDTIYHAVKSSLMEHDGRKNAVFNQNAPHISEKRVFNPFKNAQAILNKPKEIQQPQISQPQTKDVPKQQDVSSQTKNKTTDEFNPFSDIDFKPQIKENKLISKQNIDNIKVTESVNPFDIFSKQAIKKNTEKPSQPLIIEPDIKQKSSNQQESFIGESVKTEEIIKTENDVSNNFSDVNINMEPEIPQLIEKAESKKSEPLIFKSDEVQEPVLIKQNEVHLKYIGEAFNTYIIAEKNSKEIIFIDKHAAHERMIYEKLKAENAGSFSQLLLQPVMVTLGKNEYDAVINNLEMFKKCAFDVEDFGDGSVLVRSAPQYLDAADVSDCIEEMSEYIASGKKDIYTEKMDWFYHNVACRSAIKAGNKSTPQELIDIVKKLEDDPQLKYCPHGRPICIVMTKYEIEKQFGRV
ncbi:MAG: DNA mismatch repair endonuclease MutL [Ruminococcus sp.]|nr:DNA mismatch repair endonuclease MutL [Ruminococcus sp.]